ncbi:MAG: FAD-dependent oxidoreductase [Nanoarchaeota archaeon]
MAIRSYISIPTASYRVLGKNKGNVKVSSKVGRIDLKNKWIIESGKKVKYDILLSTIPFEIFVKLARGLPKRFEEQISRVRYCPGVGLCFATENFLNNKNYWINLFGERVHIIMQHSLLNDVYGDKINWCLRYGGSEEDIDLDEEEIKRLYLKDVKKYFPDVRIKWAKVFRTKFAEPIYDIHYPEYMPDYKTPVDGLYFAGIQLTYPKIRNMDVALESGMKAAKIILNNVT